MNVAVCTNAPEIPVTVIVLVLATALDAAVSVSAWGVPGVIVDVAGLTVTPAGNPVTAIPTPALNPFTPLTDADVDPLAPPAVTLTVPGITVSVKSAGAAAATLNANVAVWTFAPEVPVTVTVPEFAPAVAAAVSVTVSEVPGAIVPDAGLAVTPAGKPEIVTAIDALSPFTAPDVTVICCVAPPAVIATLAGVTDNVKSCCTTALELHPTTASAAHPTTSIPGASRCRLIPLPVHPCWKARIDMRMRLLRTLKWRSNHNP
jgi:hypothetical protein